MATSDNILQQVITYQRSSLAYLQNLCCFISTSNTKFKDFDKIEANLGDTVSFDLPTRFVANDTLVATFQAAEQRVHNLTVDQAKNTAYSFTNQQFIFNARDYMDQFGKGSVAELGTAVESNVAENAVTNTFRFAGDTTSGSLNSYEELAQALADYRTFGTAKENTKCYIPDVRVPKIIGTGLSEFALNRNNKEAMSWELGDFSNSKWYQSNLLPIHTAGNVGELAATLVVTGVTTDADGGISAITFSGAGTSDADAVKENDLFEFSDGVSGQPNIRYRTFIGHKPSAAKLQFKATADAVSDAGGNVTVSIYPKMYNAVGNKQNTTALIAAGMEVTSLASHRAGLITSGNPLYLAMPMLPEETPFPTANKVDPVTGVAMRMYYGSKFGLNERGFVNDCIWGSTLVPEYAMRLVFPL